MSELRGALRAAQRALMERLRARLPAHEAAIRDRALAALSLRVIVNIGDERRGDATLVPVLIAAADAAFGVLARIDTDMAQLTLNYQSAPTQAARREVLADQLRQRPHAAGALKQDLQALGRWLDLEAVQERLTVDAAEQLDQIEVAYRTAAALVTALDTPGEVLSAFGGGQVLSTVFRHVERGRRESLRADALKLVIALLRRLPAGERLRSLGAERYVRACAWAGGDHAPRWMRVAALELAVVAAPGRAAPVLRGVLLHRATPDRMVVRRNALRLTSQLQLPARERLELARLALDDESEHVRQELAWTLAALGDDDADRELSRLCETDKSPRVRGVAARALCTRVLAKPDLDELAEPVIERMLRAPQDKLDAAVALECVTRLCCGAQAPCRKSRFVAALAALIGAESTPPALADQAAALVRRLEVESGVQLHALAQRFAHELASLREGRSRRLRLPEEMPLRDVELALATAAREDLTVSLQPLGRGRYRLQRGEPRKLRLWRLLHELRTPAPDKRKAFAHSFGRVTRPGSVVPSHLLSEVTPTRVPGERRLSPQVGGWGPFLPRVDDLLQATHGAAPLRIVTSLGVTTVRGPSSLARRLWARLLLTFRYAHYDALRERALSGTSKEQRERYVRACRALGFAFALGETGGRVEEHDYDLWLPRVAQYLGAFTLPELRPYLEGPLQYVLTPTGNTPFQVSALVWLVLSGFLVRSAWIMSRIERARRSIPLRVGGWGTRGKSGTERLKAALFHALRYDVVVKTTGCEAMFIHARRDLPAREIFLYRPYDKATIWEQRKVLEYGARLGAHVFLWECMALNPRFVEVLNRDWMQDSVTTLTNAYPDHEDVMGPSGEDVARVIGLFMPKRGTTYTAEEQMLPILREMARGHGSELRAISPLDADLLPADLLARFPYEEHPRNIALVLALAAHFGIDRELALVEMGDRVVPDLGVLKTYPEVEYRGRRLVFSNGMSANERAGFLSNWTRLGFDRMDRDETPDTISVTVVNNRADRVPRSRVFAEIMTRDIDVNVIVVIGTNLGGMEQFIAESLESELVELSFEQGMGPAEADAYFDQWLKRMGMPVRRQTLLSQLRVMLRGAAGAEQAEAWLAQPELASAIEAREEGVGERLRQLLSQAQPGVAATLIDDIVEHAGRMCTRFRLADEGRRTVQERLAKGDLAGAAESARKTMRALNKARLFILEDSTAKGDQVVDFICSQLPPGHLARLMGCQNIKGTGLDFVYRWLSLGTVVEVLDRIESDPQSRAENLSWLTTYSDFGILDCRLARMRVEAFLQQSDESWTLHATLMESVLAHLEKLEAAKVRGLSATKKKGALERFLDTAVEPLLDHWDSTRRTALSRRVMDDLFTLRVGQGRAALLLRDLVARQKGGWLSKGLRGLLRV